MGPGGVGKSTLLRAVSGLLFQVPYADIAGRLVYRGEPIDESHHAAIVQQKLHLASASVFEHLAAHLPRREEFTRDDQRELISQRLTELGLPKLIERFDDGVTTLESVEHRLLTISAETFAEPGVLCVDEPTAALDDGDAEQVLELIAKEGLRRAVLFVTHNQRHARAVADYVGLLAGGSIIEYGTSDQFFDAPAEGGDTPICAHRRLQRAITRRRTRRLVARVCPGQSRRRRHRGQRDFRGFRRGRRSTHCHPDGHTVGT